MKNVKVGRGGKSKLEKVGYEERESRKGERVN